MIRFVVFSRLFFGATAVLGIGCLASVAAFSAEPSKSKPRPKIGLVLSGGGARGAAHVGVLKVLEELRIPVDFIAGTSMGSAVGGLYATGIPAPEMDTIFRKFDWDAALNDNPPRREQSFRRKQDDQDFLSKIYMGVGKKGFKFPRGAVEGQNFVTELRKLGRVTQDLQSFDELPIPFRCLATDLVKGESVVLGSGDLAMAIRASVSIAPMFSPVRVGGRLLVDGGYLNNIPVDVARAMGADHVIVVNIGTPMAKEETLNSITGVMSQAGRLGGEQFDRNAKKLVGKGDLLIEPDLEGLSFVDFGKVPEMINRGEAAARAMTEQLKSFSIPEEEYKAYRASRKASPTFPVADQMEIRQGGVMADEVVRTFIRQEVGKPIDPAVMQMDLARLYGLGYYEFVDYHVEKSTGGVNTLVIDAPRRSWGPNYLMLGLNLQDQFDGEGRYQLAARYLMTEVNKMGAELQVDGHIGQDPEASVQFYQPLYYGKTSRDYGAAYFVSPIMGYGRKLRFFLDDHGTRQAEYSLDSFFTGLDAGWQMSNWGEFRGGLRHTEGDLDLRVGSIPGRPSGAHLDETYGMAKLSFDTLDQVAFPHRGVMGFSEYRQSIPRWDSDFDYETIDFNGRVAHPLGERHTLMASGLLGVNLDSHAELGRVYSMGGFNRMSSFGPDELLGKNRVLAQLQYRWKGGVWSRMPWYLGALAEGGGVGDRLTDAVSENPQACGSIFAALDTIIGPFTVAYSVGSQGRDTAWLVLGSPF